LPSPDLPVDASEVISSCVFTVLKKLDGVSLVRAFVHPRKNSFDNGLSSEVKPPDTSEHLRRQILFGSGGHA
jgi:hypothetical protein